MEALGRRPDSPATWAGRRRRPGTVRTGPGELRCPGGCTCTHRQDHAHGQAPWPSTAASRRGGTAYTGRTELPALQGPLLLDSAPEGGGGRAAGLWLQRRHQGCVGLTAWAPGSVSWGLPATHVVCACRRRVAQHQETQRSVTVPSPRRARSLVTSEAGNRVPTAAPSAAASPGPSKAPSMSSPAPVRRFWPPKLCMCCSLPQAPQGELGPAGPPAGFSCAEPVSPCRPPKPNPLLWALPAEVHSAGCGCSSLPGSKAAACVLVLTCGRGWKDLSCLLL
ncbi:PREDICTED: uncharacterized protein LOC106146682 isoform X1 [Chinchilla lanigera]|uniref:uncharacterized protein LOC106146682 isoform X1 n=1 Tax=Chinchilla lanigera TaxID=34839 RepID=UPI0006977D93|nr:PREDICTED: uncharacterized protein LOC106146682 isoform X1 [Chinchilla lanigera]